MVFVLILTILHFPNSTGLLDGSAGKESPCSEGDLGSVPGLGRSPGKGNGYPLQYSGLENSMDCIVHGVAKSWTRLSDFHFTSLSLFFDSAGKLCFLCISSAGIFCKFFEDVHSNWSKVDSGDFHLLFANLNMEHLLLSFFPLNRVTKIYHLRWTSSSVLCFKFLFHYLFWDVAWGQLRWQPRRPLDSRASKGQAWSHSRKRPRGGSIFSRPTGLPGSRSLPGSPAA